MSRPRILFRADASHALGFGHVARLCALLEACDARGLEPLALFGGDVPAVGAWAGARGLPVAVGPWTPSQVAAAAAAPPVLAVIVDGPALAAAILPALPPRVRAILIDDAGGTPLAAAAVVNHNFHAPSLAPTYPGARRRLLGRRYLMLRDDIRRRGRGACRATADRRRLRVAVTFGGSDPVGATARTLSLLPPARPLEVVVIAGPGFRDEEALRTAAAAATLGGHRVEIYRAPRDPGALFAGCDAAICSAGGTLGELAYLGCPALAYAIVPDQLAPAAHQLHAGLIAGGRSFARATEADLRADLLAFLLDDAARLAIRERAIATADGDGPARIVDEAIS